jgi:hypothetical protein
MSGTTLPACKGVSFEYSTPGPVRQFVVIETLTVGSPGSLVFGGLVLLGIGDAVAEAISTVAVSVSSAGVSVITSVFVGECVSVGVIDAVSVGGGSLVNV